MKIQVLRGVGLVIGLLGVAGSAYAVGGAVQVRDSLGGETVPGGSQVFYVPGTAANISLTLNGGGVAHVSGIGAFAFDMNEGQGFKPFMTYCFEPEISILFGNNLPDAVGLPYKSAGLTDQAGVSAAEAATLQLLWGNAFADSKTSAIKAAAFQSVIWEFTQDSSFDLTAGQFKLVTDAFGALVKIQAETYFTLATDGTWTTTANIGALQSAVAGANSQDFIYEIPRMTIPLPGAAMLGAAGLFGAASIRRRRISG